MNNCPEDSALAARGYDALYHLDRFAFPDGPRPEIRWRYRIGEKPHLMFALRLNEESGEISRERYLLPARNLVRRLDKELRAMPSPYDARYRTVLLTSLAAHEVRHRLQYHARVERFTPENLPDYRATTEVVMGRLPQLLADMSAVISSLDGSMDNEFDAVMCQAFTYAYLKPFVGMDFETVILPRACEILLQDPSTIASLVPPP